MNESRRMLQQLLRQPIKRFADGGPTALFGPPPREEDTVAPAAGPTVMQPAPTIAPVPGPTISASPAPTTEPAPAPTYATRQQIEDIYRNTLGRRGEQAGLDWWTNTAQQANLSPDQLRAEIAKSQEFQQWSPYDIDRSGGVSEAERRAAVNQVYQNILAREGEQAGLDYWMQSGLTPQEMQKHFQESAEFRSWAPYDTDNSGTLTQDERRQGINALYQNTFGRAADEEGAAFWLNTMLTPDQLLTKFRESPEWRDVSVFDVNRSGTISPAERQSYVESVAAKGQVADLGKVSQPVDATKITTSPVVDTGTTYGGAAPQTKASSQQITDLYQSIFGRAPDAAGLDYWIRSGLSADQIRQHFLGSTEWGALSPFDVNVDQQISAAERANYLASLQPKAAVELPKAREAMELPEAPEAIELPKVEVRDVPEVKPAEIDTAFRESAARTFDPVTQSFQYSAPAKLSSATGAGMTWVPPTVTSRPRQLLNVAFTAGQGGYDPTTGTLYQPAMSASQRYGTDRTRQLGALQQAVSQAGFQPSSSGMIRLQNQLRAGGFRKEDGTIDTAALQAAVAALKPLTQAGPPAPSPAPTGSNVPEAFRTLDPINFSPR